MKQGGARTAIAMGFCMEPINTPVLHLRKVLIRDESLLAHTHTHLIIAHAVQIGSTRDDVAQNGLGNLVVLWPRHVSNRQHKASSWINGHEPAILSLPSVSVFARSTDVRWWSSRAVDCNLFVAVHYHFGDFTPLCSRELMLVPPLLVVHKEAV